LVIEHISSSFIKTALLLGIFMFGFILVSPVQAQTTTTEQQTPASSDPKSDLKTSLNSLLTLSQNEVQRLEKQHNVSQDLYKDGLIARIELEKTEQALADARAKVEDLTKQIAAANAPVSVALLIHVVNVPTAMKDLSNIA